MTDLIADLAEVVALSERATDGEWTSTIGHHVKQVGGVIVMQPWEGRGAQQMHNAAYIAALHNFIRAHAAEIEAMARDAERYRALRSGELIEDSGDDPAGLEVTQWGDDGTGSPSYGDNLDAAIDAAMRSAKENSHA